MKLRIEKKLLYTVSRGNAKFKATKNTRYIIWNLPAKKSCPYATAHCGKDCYAKSSERYPTCRNSRSLHFEQSKQNDFVERMIFTIEYYLNLPSYRAAKKVIFRIHESGDFYNLEYVEKWLKIIDHFKGNKKLVFGAYTKSTPFFIQAGYYHGKHNNFILNGSIWDDTKPERIQEYKKMNLPIYTALTTEQLKNMDNVFVCGCAGCGTKCNACYCFDKKYQNKAVIIH